VARSNAVTNTTTALKSDERPGPRRRIRYDLIGVRGCPNVSARPLGTHRPRQHETLRLKKEKSCATYPIAVNVTYTQSHTARGVIQIAEVSSDCSSMSSA